MYVTIIVRKHLSLLPLFCRCPPQCQSMWTTFTSPASWDKERTSPWPCSPRDHTTILLSTNRSPASAGIFGFGWHRGEYFFSVQKYSIRSVSCRNIHIMVYCAKVLVSIGHYTMHCNVLDKCRWCTVSCTYTTQLLLEVRRCGAVYNCTCK